MKFSLIDDDTNVLHRVKRIIRDRGLGEMAGKTVWMHSRILLL